QSFKSTLNDERREQLEECDDKPKFATKFIKPSFPYSPSLRNRDLEVYDIESVYAFDNLILNVDRRKGKPNIFHSDSSYYLIDHEQTLHLQEGDEDFNVFINRCPFQNHIFFKYLVKLNKKGNLEGF